jgi:hypothetical protein
MRKIIIAIIFSVAAVLAVMPAARAEAALFRNRDCLQSGKLVEFVERWQAQDERKSSLRGQADVNRSAGFDALERSLTGAPTRHKEALMDFRSALETAARERRAAVDRTTEEFRAGIRNALENEYLCLEVGDIDLLALEYRASVHGSTEVFKAAVRGAQADFKAALAR